jgi:general secretion pathway protein B
MSYILEALRKAERERNLGQVPTLEAKTADAAPSPRSVWPWLLAGALVVNAGVLALWLLYPREQAAAPVPPPLATTETRVLSPPVPPPSVSDYMPPSPTLVDEEPISEPPVVTVREPVLPEPASARYAEPRAGESAANARPRTEPVEAHDAHVDEPAIDDRQATIVALRDMPPEFRRSLPAMKMDAHFYTEVEGRSFVMINLRKYKVGERLAEGPQVVEIVGDGVILSHQGREFLLTP